MQYAYTDPEYKSWEEVIDTDGNTRDLTRTPFFFTPEHAFTATVSYGYPLNDGGTLRFSASASWQDDIWINSLQTISAIEQHPPEVRPALQQEDYWLVNATADWESIKDSNLDISLYVKNLTDEEYTVGGIQLYHTIGLSSKVYAEPRTYGMQVQYSF